MKFLLVTANFLKIPVAHIHGGELTYGAIDDAFRHSITKMSHVHFNAYQIYKKELFNLVKTKECTCCEVSVLKV